MQKLSASSRSLWTIHAPRQAEKMAVPRKAAAIASHDERRGACRNDRDSREDPS
jgi:hypothetical protein